MKTLTSQKIPRLDNCNKEILQQYFINSWHLEETLLKTIINEETFYQQSDKLRNPLIFYVGHSAVFYINKLIQVDLIKKRINPESEILFEIGVDPDTPQELDQVIKNINWGNLADIWQYRNQVYETILKIIDQTKLNLPITQNHPLWALMMGIEHSRIHFETSSVLLRQLPPEALKAPENWQYAPTFGAISDNPMMEIEGGKVTFGKDQDFPTFGWDSEYGSRQEEVKPFLASKYLITNGEFLKFIKAGGYENQDFWSDIAWKWKTQDQVKHPKFWLDTPQGYQYRAMFDIVALPLDYPVEVNHYEALAYCRWLGKEYHLMTEAQWNIANISNNNKYEDQYTQDVNLIDNYNLNLKWGSPTPVNFLENQQTNSKLRDLRGNVWQWLGDNFNPLAGFKTHFLYEDQSAPFFDEDHKMMLGGSWASNGSMTSQFYRNWFRPHFYQHAGFRVVKDFK